MTAASASVLFLHDPVKVGSSWQCEWFDPAHNHSVLYAEGYFYVICYDDENPISKLFFHKSDLVGEIVTAKVSLNKELLAIQLSFSSLLVVDVVSRKTWIVDMKAGDLIIKDGVIWSDHGGNSQDLILVTNKGLELFKITPKRGHCRLSRSIAQPAFAFWYNPRHRLILLASYAKPSVKTKSKKDILLMDGYFFKTERSVMPTLELPPPDKAPRFEIGPGISSDCIHLVSAYGHALAMVHYISGAEDLLTVYLMTKASTERIYSLSLGAGITGGLRISTLDNLIICHNLAAKQSLVFDLMTSARVRQSVASIDQLEPLAAPCTVVARDDVADDQCTSEDPDNAAEWNAVAILSPMAADLRDFNSLRFADDSSDSICLQRGLRLTRLPIPRPVYSFYFSVLFDILGENFAFDREANIMWRLGGDLVALASGPLKEQARFLARRGRVYDFPGSTDMLQRARIWFMQDSKLAKFALLRVLLDMLSAGTSCAQIIEYIEAISAPYISEHHRQQITDEESVEEVGQQSKALQAMDLAQPPVRRLGPPQASTGRRPSITDLFSGRGARQSKAVDTGLLDLCVDLGNDPLEPFGLSSALFSDITSLGMRAKAWKQQSDVDDRSRAPSAARDTFDRSKTRSASIKPANDCTLLQLRRDSKGDIIVSQTEMVTFVWVPFLLRCKGKLFALWSQVLTEYMSGLAEEGIARTPALSVLQLNLLFYTGEYHSIVGNLRMKLYSDAVEVAFMLLQFADLLLEESEICKTKALAQTLSQHSHILSKEGTDMLWRLNEKIAVIKWQLTKGKVQEALDLCRNYSSSDSELSSRYISGIEFFTAAVKVIEKLQQDKLTESNSAVLLYNVYSFLTSWDSAILSKNMSTGRSRLCTAAPFPTLSLPDSAADDLKGLFGY